MRKGDFALIGVREDDDSGTNSGSVYMFKGPNQSPNLQAIDGPASGKQGISYDYNFIVVDPEGDEVYYWTDWGDNSSVTEWIGPYPSGQLVIVSHTFSKKGTFMIKYQTKDTYNALSD